MAEVKRIANKSSINNGTTSADLSLNDKLLTQHTSGDNTDKSISILQAQLTPYGTCATASATATKTVTMVNFPDDFTALIGTKIRVKFTYANTSTSQMYLKVGSLPAKPATCRGIAMGSGSIRAGAEIEFMYDGTNWDSQFSEPISSIDTNSDSPVNSSAVNGALEKYERIVYLEEDYASYTNDEFVAHLTTTYNVPNGRSVTFILNNNYGKRIGIKDFLGGSTQYDFICGKCTLTRFASGQFSIIYDINTYYIGSYRYYENILAEYSITTTGQGKWNYYIKDTDLNNALGNYESLVKSGDRYNFSASIVYGYLTNASQHLFFFIPTQKNFYGKSLKFETLKLIIRQNGYYIFPKENTTAPNNEVNLLDTEEYQVQIVQSEAMQNGIRLQCIAPAWYRQSSSNKATNNETFTALLSSCNFTVN